MNENERVCMKTESPFVRPSVLLTLLSQVHMEERAETLAKNKEAMDALFKRRIDLELQILYAFPFPPLTSPPLHTPPALPSSPIPHSTPPPKNPS